MSSNRDTFSLDTDAIQMVKTNLVPLTAPPDAPQPNAAGQYDLLPFLRGSPLPHILKLTWAGDETIWTEPDGDNRWRLRKNVHSEEFGLKWVDGVEYIVRGIDDSPGDGEAYILKNEDGSEGSPWSPRWMRVGETFKRTAVVTFYDLATGAFKRKFTHVTWLKFIRYHPTWMSQYGVTVPHVIEMEAYEDANGRPGVVFERYKYAAEKTLVYWNGGPALSLISGIAPHSGSLTKPPRITLSWYEGLELPKMADIIFSPGDSRWSDYTIKTRGTDNVRIRKIPSTTGETLGWIKAGVEQPIQSIDRQTQMNAAEKAYSFDVEGKPWFAVKVTDDKGVVIVGWTREDVAERKVVIVDPPEPEPEPEPPPILTEMERVEMLEVIDELQASYQADFARLEALKDKLKGGQ